MLPYFSEGIKYILGRWNFFCFPHICFFWRECAYSLYFLHIRGFLKCLENCGFLKMRDEGKKKMIGNSVHGWLVTLGISSSITYICRSVLMSGGLAVGKGWWDFTEQALTQLPGFSRVPHPCPQLCWKSALPEGKFSVFCLDMQSREENMGT